MYCEKYKATIPEKTCVARQGRDWKIAPFCRTVTDPGCQNCEQGRQVMVNFKINQKTEENMPDPTKTPHQKCIGTRRGRPRVTPAPDKDIAAAGNKKRESRTVLVIDFSGRQDLLEEIRAAAENEFRTPEMQVLWWLSTPKETTRSL